MKQQKKTIIANIRLVLAMLTVIGLITALI